MPTTSELDGTDAPPGDALRDQHLVALHEVVGAVARQTDPRATLSLIAEKARALTGAASAAVSLLDPSRTLLDFAAVAGADAADIVGQTVRVEDALAGRTALTGETYLTHHPSASDTANASDPTVAPGVGVQSAIVVPLFLDGAPSGALSVLNRTDGGAFSGGDLLRLQTLAGLAAQALRMDALRRLAAQKQQERDILFRAAQTTSSSLNVQEVLGSVLATIVGSMEMTAGAVFLLSDERTRLYIGADRGLAEEDQDRQLPADGPGLAALALATGQPLRISDLGDDPEGDPPLPECGPCCSRRWWPVRSLKGCWWSAHASRARTPPRTLPCCPPSPPRPPSLLRTPGCTRTPRAGRRRLPPSMNCPRRSARP